ncbi:MAG: bifunctional metallophosphatase/5'-nucleotidase, partial [Myxococcota bacterium]
MNRSHRRAFLKSASGLVTGCAVLGPTVLCARRSHAAPSGRLTLLHTNATHSRLEPFQDGPFRGRGGVSRRATLIKRARANNPHTLVLDAGDTFQGTPWFNEFKGSVDLEAMSLMGYDATALGNHDFDAGVDVLFENLQRAPHLAALAANFDIEEGTPLSTRVRPHRIYEFPIADDVQPWKVGVFGLGVRFEGLVNPRMHEGVRYLDPIPVAREQVGLLRAQGCQVVVAVSHLGYQGYAG